MDWYHSSPVAARTTLLGHHEFRLASQWYLGMRVLDEAQAGCPCPKCGRPLDVWGDHPVACPLNGLTERHTEIRDKLLDFARRGGLTASKEEALPDGDRPADLLIRRWDNQGTAAIDVTCTHPLKQSDNNSTPDMAQKALQAAQEAKNTKYHARCTAVRWQFLPAVCHTYGGWHGTGKTIVHRLTQRVRQEESGEGDSGNNSDPTAELSYTMAAITGRLLSITLDAGFHDTQIPKRPRLSSEPTPQVA